MKINNSLLGGRAILSTTGVSCTLSGESGGVKQEGQAFRTLDPHDSRSTVSWRMHVQNRTVVIVLIIQSFSLDLSFIFSAFASPPSFSPWYLSPLDSGPFVLPNLHIFWNQNALRPIDNKIASHSIRILASPPNPTENNQISDANDAGLQKSTNLRRNSQKF